jgi:hypothetical protein
MVAAPHPTTTLAFARWTGLSLQAKALLPMVAVRVVRGTLRPASAAAAVANPVVVKVAVVKPAGTLVRPVARPLRAILATHKGA